LSAKNWSVTLNSMSTKAFPMPVTLYFFIRYFLEVYLFNLLLFPELDPVIPLLFIRLYRFG
jgi:hypothetical protein